MTAATPNDVAVRIYGPFGATSCNTAWARDRLNALVNMSIAEREKTRTVHVYWEAEAA
jgi:hypothetical protein